MVNDICKNFYSRIDSLLQERGLLQKDLCSAIGVSPASFTNFKGRNNLLPLEIALNVAEFFHVSVEYLVYGIDYSSDLTLKDVIEENKRLKSKLAEIASITNEII